MTVRGLNKPGQPGESDHIQNYQLNLDVARQRACSQVDGIGRRQIQDAREVAELRQISTKGKSTLNGNLFCLFLSYEHKVTCARVRATRKALGLLE